MPLWGLFRKAAKTLISSSDLYFGICSPFTIPALPESRLQAALTSLLILVRKQMGGASGGLGSSSQGHPFYTDGLVPVITKTEAQLCFSKKRHGRGIAQQLRALAALTEDLSSIPSTHMVAHSPKGPDAIF